MCVNAHAGVHVPSGATRLMFCLSRALPSHVVYARSQGSGETVRMRRLVETFAARLSAISTNYILACWPNIKEIYTFTKFKASVI